MIVRVSFNPPGTAREPLRDIIARLDDLPRDAIICVEGKPAWTAASPAYVVHDPLPDASLPHYFLEAAMAQMVLDAWSHMRGGRAPSLSEQVEAIIHYATNDAYLTPPDKI
jgi:hypothetical protein